MERERGGTVAAAVSASAASAGGASADDMINDHHNAYAFLFFEDRSNARQILFDELFHVGIVSSLVCW